LARAFYPRTLLGADPHEPLTHLTEAAVERVIADGRGRIRERTLDLLPAAHGRLSGTAG
jgi:hypothetical protein